MAEMSGRVTHLYNDQGTGALESVRIENARGEVWIVKPDVWTDSEAFEGSIGRNVAVRVVVTVVA